MIRTACVLALLYLPFGLGCGCDKKNADFILEKEVEYKDVYKIEQSETTSGLTVTLVEGDKTVYLPKSGNNELVVHKDLSGISRNPYAVQKVFKDKNSKDVKYKTELHVTRDQVVPGEPDAPNQIVCNFKKPKVETPVSRVGDHSPK